MAEHKGLMVEIGADTKKMNRAINELQAPLKKLQSELHYLDRALKLDPKNADLLKQKMRLLEGALKEAEGNAESLRAELNRLKSLNAPDEQIRRLERELVEADAQAKKLKKDLDAFKLSQSSIGRLATNFQTVGSKATKLGNQFRGVSIATGLIGGMAIRTTAEFDSAMSKVQAISGATGEQFNALRDKAREMGSKTKFSATESAEALTYMSMAGWKTEDMLSGLEGVMNLAAASGEDLSTTSDIVTDAMTAFGLSAEDSTHFADVLAAASANANTNVGMMGETFKYAAPVAGALGYSIEDTSLAIGLMANSGIKASQAGTSLRNIMSRLASPTGATKKAMDDLGISLTDSDGKMKPFNEVVGDLRESMSGLSETEKTQIATDIAGKNAMAGFLAIVNSSDKDFEKLSSAIANSDGAAQEMAETMQDNLGGQLTILKSQLQELAISMGDTLTPIVKGMVSVLQKIVDGFNKLPDGVKRAITVMVGLVAILAPALTVFGLMVTGIGNAIGIIMKVPGAFSKVFSVISKLIPLIGGFLGPVGSAILIIGGLIAVFNLLGKSTDDVDKAIQIFVTKISAKISMIAKVAPEIILSFVNTITEQLPVLIDSAVSVIQALITGITNNLPMLINAGIKLVMGLVNGLIQAIPILVASLPKIISALARGLYSMRNQILQAGIKLIIALAKGIIQAIPRARAAILNLVRRIPGWIKSGVKGLASIGANIVSGLWSGIGNKARWLKSKISGFVGNVKSWLKKFFKIGSPSKLMADEIGRWIPEGLAVGIEENMRGLHSAVNSMADATIPDLNSEAVINGGVDYDRLAAVMVNAMGNATFEATTYLDGKKVSRNLANDMNGAINNVQTRQSRRLGYVGV